MKNQDKYKNIPHGELIVENGSITIPSIFMFETISQVQSFLHSCKVLNCSVTFENEGLTASPDNYESTMSYYLVGYGGIMARPKFAEDYIKYLFHKDNMTWDKVKETEIVE